METMTIPNFCRVCGERIPCVIGVHYCSAACEDRFDFDWSDSRVGNDWEDDPTEEYERDCDLD